MEKTVHIWLFSRLRDREGGVGMTMRSLGKIFTKVVFELTTKGRAGCQVCACFGGKPVCAPGLENSRCPGGSDGVSCKVVRVRVSPVQ